MPTTEFGLGELNSLLGRTYPPEELRDTISMLGVDVECLDREKIVMEVFPNRPDMLGIEGFARALKGVLGVETGLVPYSVLDSGMRVLVDPSVKAVRPYIAAGIVRGISFTEERLVSLMNIQEKLHITHGRNRKKVAIGVHDMSKVTAPFYYTTAGPSEISFVPLDMQEKLSLGEILETHPKGRMYASALAGMDRYPIILDRDRNVLSFPPIINGELTRLSKKTKEVFIDVTGTDRNAVSQALSIIVASILDRGGKAYTVEIKG